MPIIWNKKLSVSNELIDHDHQFLINLINTVELLLLCKENISFLLEVFNQLHEYSVNHFRREESIQRKIEYNKSLQQKHSHTKLLNELETLKKDISGEKSLEELTEKADNIIIFLRNWLINHIIDEDLLMKPYLEKYPVAFS
ncbi:MAG: bacteriohemerythrin [Melioribacteraceae bacterium]|nr:bacteriohemerythrin [Melioribacteraceae bacterium]